MTFVSEVLLKPRRRIERWNSTGVRLGGDKIFAIMMHEGAVQLYGMSLTLLPDEPVPGLTRNNVAACYYLIAIRFTIRCLPMIYLSVCFKLQIRSSGVHTEGEQHGWLRRGDTRPGVFGCEITSCGRDGHQTRSLR